MNETARAVLEEEARRCDEAAERQDERAAHHREALGEAEADAANARLMARQLREAAGIEALTPSDPSVTFDVIGTGRDIRPKGVAECVSTTQMPSVRPATAAHEPTMSAHPSSPKR